MNVLPTWLGSFYGSDFSRLQCENIVITKFLKYRELESTCIENRWFDYARLHPLQATSYFVECYRRAYANHAKKVFGKTARGARENFLEGREAATFWKIRQCCDMFGFKYDWFCNFALNRLLTNGEFKNRIPRPCHIQPDEESIKELTQAWATYTNGQTLVLAIDPWYRTVNWEGHQQQRRYEDFLVQQLKGKRIKHYALQELLYKHKVLRFERAYLEFRDDIGFAQTNFA